MEKEDSFFGKNWPAVEAPSSYAASNHLPQSFLGHLEAGLGANAHLDGFDSSVCAALQRQQWSGAADGADRFGSHCLSSPPELNLALLSPFLQWGAGTAERVTRMPCFVPAVLNHDARFPLSETGRLPRGFLHHVGQVEGNNEIPIPSRSSTGEEVELRESSASEQSNARKRKLAKVGEEGSGEAVVKRSRAADEVKPKIEAEKPQREEAAKEAEAPKQDYIHVRARRGQATDAHSLAERVRREKISERMKFLQNLVPGCNKVTGKAVMLDEIINYVQSLQRQVEFLSMKLATVNPRLDISVETPRQKDMQKACGSSSRGAMYAMESPAPSFPFAQAVVGTESHCSPEPLDPTLTRQDLGVQFAAFDGFTNTASSQAAGFWGDDLHRVVQMGCGQSQDAALPSHTD